MKVQPELAPKVDSPRKTKLLFSAGLVDFVLSGERPSESIGQNFLVDPEAAMTMARHTLFGAEVVEIGTGIGNLTRVIAQQGASRVITLDIDPRLRRAQEIVLDGVPNVDIRQQDAVKFRYDHWIRQDPEARHQVIGNIPYHISEPLITRLAQVADNLDDITLMVGDKLAEALTTTSPHAERFSKLTFIASIFDITVSQRVPRSSFYPVPPTDSVIINMTPKEVATNESQTAFGLRKAIIASSEGNMTLAKVINGYGSSGNDSGGKRLDKSLSHKRDRRQERNKLGRLKDAYNDMPISRRHQGDSAKDLMMAMNTGSGLADRLGLPQSMLSKPFNRLDNEEVRQLAVALQKV